MKRSFIIVVILFVIIVLIGGKPVRHKEASKIENAIERVFVNEFNMCDTTKANLMTKGNLEYMLNGIRKSCVIDSILELSPDTIYGYFSQASSGGCTAFIWTDTIVFEINRLCAYNYNNLYKCKYMPFPTEIENGFINQWDKSCYKKYMDEKRLHTHPYIKYFIVRIIRKGRQYKADGFII